MEDARYTRLIGILVKSGRQTDVLLSFTDKHSVKLQFTEGDTLRQVADHLQAAVNEIEVVLRRV